MGSLIRKFSLAKGMFLTKIFLAKVSDRKPQPHTPVKKISEYPPTGGIDDGDHSDDDDDDNDDDADDADGIIFIVGVIRVMRQQWWRRRRRRQRRRWCT